jgi:NitT/TauT family transport system permease protein
LRSGRQLRQRRARLQIALDGSNFQMPTVFAALLLLAVEGIAMYAVFACVEVCLTRWAFQSSMSATAWQT